VLCADWIAIQPHAAQCSSGTERHMVLRSMLDFVEVHGKLRSRVACANRTQQQAPRTDTTPRKQKTRVQVDDLEAQLAQASSERAVYHRQAEDLRAKHKAKRKEWADERRRLVRTIDAQTRTNTVQLHVRPRSAARCRACTGLSMLHVAQRAVSRDASPSCAAVWFRSLSGSEGHRCVADMPLRTANRHYKVTVQSLDMRAHMP
jgi:hypothetical protein